MSQSKSIIITSLLCLLFITSQLHANGTDELSTEKQKAKLSLNSVVKSLSGTVNGVGKTLGSVKNGVGKTLNDTMKDIGKSLEGTINGVDKGLDKTLKGVGEFAEGTVKFATGVAVVGGVVVGTLFVDYQLWRLADKMF